MSNRVFFFLISLGWQFVSHDERGTLKLYFACFCDSRPLGLLLVLVLLLLLTYFPFLDAFFRFWENIYRILWFALVGLEVLIGFEAWLRLDVGEYTRAVVLSSGTLSYDIVGMYILVVSGGYSVVRLV